jgi:hypothetical protein
MLALKVATLHGVNEAGATDERLVIGRFQSFQTVKRSRAADQVITLIGNCPPIRGSNADAMQVQPSGIGSATSTVYLRDALQYRLNKSLAAGRLRQRPSTSEGRIASSPSDAC